MAFDNKYIKKGIIRVIYTHAISIIATAFMTFYIPKMINVVDYGIYQLFILYSSYVGFFHFGWADGLYLKLIGIDFEDIDTNKIKFQFFSFIISQMFVSIFLYFFISNFNNVNLKLILFYLAITLVFTNINTLHVYILQATGKVKQYTNIQLSKTISLILFFIILLRFYTNYRSILVADIFANIVSFIVGCHYCKKIYLSKITFDFKNILTYINIGIKLMLANILSMLITGVIKFSIESNFGIETFGKVSFSLTLTALLVNILNLISYVFIPAVKNYDLNKSKKLYDNLYMIIDIVIFTSMIFYQPIRYIFSNYILHEYKESFTYLGITFPIIYFSCIQSLLQHTFLKAKRCEAFLLYSNILILLFSFVLLLINKFFTHNLYFLLFSILLIYIFRNIVYELFIHKNINNINYANNILCPTLVTLCFSISNYFFDNYINTLIYLFVFMLWLFFNKNSFRTLLNK